MRAPEFWTSDRPAARILSALLLPFGALYGLSVRRRMAGARPYRAKARVLCVGNLTAGGSGKTPIAMALAQLLIARGQTVVFLSRGYGGRIEGPVQVDPSKHSSADVGDEPLLLAAIAPTVVARDRARGAALADTLGADVIVMDDGFQNFQLVKDASIVVVDADTGFGNGRLIPAGPLREPVEQGLARADAAVLVGDGAFALHPFRGAVLRARLQPSAPNDLAGRAVFAFAGIGRPEKFFLTLGAMGAQLAGTRSFPDHHRYATAELQSVRKAASESEALLVTTEKDFVRIDAAQREGILAIPVRAVFEEEAKLDAVLDRLAAARA